ncbi:hypothetical protein FQN49_004989 [Arthroderma sp. PD_2]|nr:hypothetical protein FQN49_004989 [Arthroderma sp. PD_2]
MATPDSRQSARELVHQIAGQHGDGRTLEDAYTTKDEIARYVFELLQNADDYGYTKAKEAGVVAFVSFRVYPRLIVMECNEDGTTSEDLATICSIGKSYKVGQQDHIAEKGIGFKSVFMAAWKVHIQSGHFSLSFTHRKDDSGMGVISPVWQEHAEDGLDETPTRITLHLHDSGDPAMLAEWNERTQAQFSEIQETFLLFMKNIGQVHIVLFDEQGQSMSSTTYEAKDLGESFTAITKTQVSHSIRQEDTKYFHVIKQRGIGVAKHENRVYSEEEEVTRAYSNTEVVLAFPVTKDSVPIIDNQGLSCFLPMRKLGFSFIIQADFDTNAKRQDIVTDSLRNNDLLEVISGAFENAIYHCFCEHDTLKYQWMRYLPDTRNQNWDPFWLTLVEKIEDRVSNRPVIFGQTSLELCLMKSLYRIDSTLLDEDGMPLFDDDTEQIISQKYSQNDLDILSSYGLKDAGVERIIGWVTNDLKAGQGSRLKSHESTDDWHTRVAKLLCSLFNHGDINLAVLKSLDLVPLENGTWASTSSKAIFFSSTTNLEIPSDVKINLVSKDVVNLDRLELFKRLGVKIASRKYVRRKILQKYRDIEAGIKRGRIDLAGSKKHLMFLYCTEFPDGDGEDLYSSLFIWDENAVMCQPKTTYIYISNDDSYGPRELLRETNPGDGPGEGAPGRTAYFVNEEYFVDGPSTSYTQKLTWLEWFYKKLGVDRYISLGQYDGLTPEGKYLQKHRPEKFLGALHAWYTISGKISEECVRKLKETYVLCRGNRLVVLRYAYFPTIELERLVERYVEPHVFFPWLWLDEEIDYQSPAWNRLLAKLGMTLVNDVDLALSMLGHSIDYFPLTDSSRARASLFNLYHYIQEKYQESSDKLEAQEQIRNYFEEKCIYIPISSTDYTWATLEECVWGAPQKLHTAFSLQRLYEPYLQLDGADSSVSYFFRTILEVPDAGSPVYLNELRWYKDHDSVDFNAIKKIYTALDDLRKSNAKGLKRIREEFEECKRIYFPACDGPSWHNISECVWSSAAKLRGRIQLNECYGDFQEFFVNFLGVKPVDLNMAIDELREASRQRPVANDAVKASIWAVNLLLAAEMEHPDPIDILKYSEFRLFPVKFPNGAVICCSTATNFFIPDRETLIQSFKRKVNILDFTLEEVVLLQPFLQWTGVDRRNISLCVREINRFQGGDAILITNPDRQIRKRAHALLRIASHFDNPRSRSRQDLTSLYETLRNTDIYATDGIVSLLQLSQDGKDHEVEGKRTTLVIDRDGSSLKIYIPRNEDDQLYTFTNLLARKLFMWMMDGESPRLSEGSNNDGINAVRDILLAPYSRLDTALDDNGIATIDISNQDEEIFAHDKITGTLPDTIVDATRMDLESSSDSELEAILTPSSSVGSSRLSVDTVTASSLYGSSLTQ